MEFSNALLFLLCFSQIDLQVSPCRVHTMGVLIAASRMHSLAIPLRLDFELLSDLDAFQISSTRSLAGAFFIDEQAMIIMYTGI